MKNVWVQVLEQEFQRLYIQSEVCKYSFVVATAICRVDHCFKRDDLIVCEECVKKNPRIESLQTLLKTIFFLCFVLFFGFLFGWFARIGYVWHIQIIVTIFCSRFQFQATTCTDWLLTHDYRVQFVNVTKRQIRRYFLCFIKNAPLVGVCTNCIKNISWSYLLQVLLVHPDDRRNLQLTFYAPF